MPDARLQVYLGEDGPYGGWPGAVSDEASGKIFAVPAYANHGVLVIDPSLSTNGGPLFSTGASPFGLSVLPVPAAPFQAGDELGWTAAVQDPVSRKIIGLPRSGATGLLVIDPNDESVEVVRLSGTVREYMASATRRPQWTGAAYHPWTRNIVAVPSNGPLPVGTFISPRQDLLKIDPATMATQLQLYDPPRNDAGGNRIPAVVEGWQTAVFEPISGQIIGIPFTAPSVLAVNLPDGVVVPTADPTVAPVTTAPATTAPALAPTPSTPAPALSTAVVPVPVPVPTPTPTASLADGVEGGPDDAGDSSLLFGLSGMMLIGAAAGVFCVAALVCCCACQRQKRWNAHRDHFGGWGGGSSSGSGSEASMVNPVFAGFKSGERAAKPGHSGPDRVPEMEKPSYVPLSTVMNLTREESQKQLKGFSTGSFVIRPSPRSPTGVSISVIYDCYGVATIANFTLERDHGGFFVGGNQRDKFSTFEELLTTACIQTIPPFPCALNPLPDDTVLRLSRDRKGGSPAPALRGEESTPRRSNSGSSIGPPPSASRAPKGSNAAPSQLLTSVEEASPPGPAGGAAPPQRPIMQLDEDDYVQDESKPVLNIDMNPANERRVLKIDMNDTNPNLAEGDPGWVHPGDEVGTELEI